MLQTIQCQIHESMQQGTGHLVLDVWHAAHLHWDSAVAQVTVAQSHTNARAQNTPQSAEAFREVEHCKVKSFKVKVHGTDWYKSPVRVQAVVDHCHLSLSLWGLDLWGHPRHHCHFRLPASTTHTFGEPKGAAQTAQQMSLLAWLNLTSTTALKQGKL
jgi:hypothetical protein